MPRLPFRFAAVILNFTPLFCQRSWRHAEMLLIGAILVLGIRHPHGRQAAAHLRADARAALRELPPSSQLGGVEPALGIRLLLNLLVAAFALDGPVVLGIDDTIERRRSKRIATKGIYCDPVRSFHGYFVKTSGLRWLSLMLLVPIP